MNEDLNLEENPEIQKALREFEIKDQAEAARSTETVQRAVTPPMVQRFMKYSGGLIRTEEQARYALLGLSVFAIVVSLIVIMSGGPDVPPEALENPEYGLPEAS